jgi:pyruvate dehydrogenase E2 component (dihydrolipoamide acetyltransferase)
MPTEVLVPPLGQTVDTMNFVTWLKQEGELVRQGEALYVIETDKAMLDVEAPATGVLARVRAQKGDAVKALAPIAVILAEGEALEGEERTDSTSESAKTNANAQDERRESRQPGERVWASPRARRLAETEGVPLAQVDASGPENAVVERDVRAYLREREAARRQAAAVAESAPPAPAVSPLARRLAEDAGLDLGTMRGTGPRGQITREDVEAAAAARAQGGRDERAQPGGAESLPLTGPRKVIAERMSASSRETAAVTLTSEADATAFVQLRERLAGDGVAVSYNDLMVYALGKALRQHPGMNASLDAEGIKAVIASAA